VPNATLVRFLEPFELPFEEVEPFHVSHIAGSPASCAALRSAAESAPAEVMVGDHLVHPGEAVEMLRVQQARLRCAQRGEDARPHSCRGSERPGHPLREVAAGGAFEMIPVVPPWVWTSTEMDFRRRSNEAAPQTDKSCASGPRYGVGRLKSGGGRSVTWSPPFHLIRELLRSL
jgi:hypothetical protein